MLIIQYKKKELKIYKKYILINFNKTMFDAIFILFIVTFLIYIYMVYVKHPNYKIVNFSDIEHKLKTGDLIFFHGLDNINSIFVLCYYNHVGVVYKYNGVMYLFEAFNYAQSENVPKEFNNGIGLFNLKNRMTSYRGYVFYKELKTPINLDIEKNGESIIEYMIKNMSYNPNLITDGLKNIIFNKKLTTHTNCGELAYMVLIKLNIIGFDNIYKNRKHHLRWLSNIKKTHNNEYKDMVYVYPNVI